MKNFIKAIIAIGLVTFCEFACMGLKRGGGTAVLTAFVEESVVSDTTVIPGAMIAPSPMVVSSLRNGAIMMEDLQIGSFIRQGTLIARQDDDDLVYDLKLLELQVKDTKERLAELDANTQFDESFAQSCPRAARVVASKRGAGADTF